MSTPGLVVRPDDVLKILIRNRFPPALLLPSRSRCGNSGTDNNQHLVTHFDPNAPVECRTALHYQVFIFSSAQHGINRNP